MGDHGIYLYGVPLSIGDWTSKNYFIPCDEVDPFFGKRLVDS